MNKYRVVFIRETALDWHDVEAPNEDDAIEKASMLVHKHDLDDCDYEQVELLEDEG